MENGSDLLEREGAAVRMRRFRLRREAWRPPFDIEVEGLEPCLALLVGG